MKRGTQVVFDNGPYAGQPNTTTAGTPWLIRVPNPQRYENPKAPSFLAYRLAKVVAHYELEGATDADDRGSE